MVAPVPTAPASDPTAVFGRRVLAAVLDGLLVLVPTLILVTSSFQYLEEEDITGSGAAFCEVYNEQSGTRFCADFTDVDGRVYFSDSVDASGTAYYWGVSVAMYVLLQGLTGWTPGKLVTGLRTVGEDGRRPGLGKALIRWVMWVVDGLPFFLPLVALITGLTTKGHRRVGDMAAKTFVVRAGAAGAPIVVPGLTAPAPPAGYSAGGWGSPPPPQSGAPTGWGPTVDPGAGWGAPSGGTTTTAAPAGAPAPQWDEARGTYIQWDPAEGAWMQWDEPGQRWFKIQGQ
jgi:uncharacterized RDD family membrane protein YckC